MGNWNDIHEEITAGQIKRQRESPSDQVRRKYLLQLQQLTGRNTIAYYSGWLQRSGPDFAAHTSITDDDKNGFMSCFRGWDWTKGLDVILHLPGGSVAATETIIDYIRSKFGDDVRMIVPQISMSGGTMLACAGREIVMGLHSNLGPIDPQFGSWPAIALLKEFERAVNEVKADPNMALMWQPIIAQYPPTLLGSAQHAIEWSREIGRKALREGMLKGDPDATHKAEEIIEFLLSHDIHRAHGRHLHRKDLQDKGLKIVELEKDQKLQDAVLSVHHAFMHTLMNTNAVKIIESHDAIALIRNLAVQFVQGPTMPQQPQPVPAPSPPNTPQTQPESQPQPAQIPRLGLLQRITIALRVLFVGR